METAREKESPVEPAWTVTYTLTHDDVARFRNHYARSKRDWARIAIAALTIVVVVTGSLNRMGWMSLAEGGILVLIAFGIVAIGRRRRSQKPAQNKEVTVEIDSQGIFQTDGDVRSRYLWQALHRIARDSGATYYFIAEQRAVIVPDRAFAGADDARACYEQSGKWREARGSEATLPESKSPFTVTYIVDDAAILQSTYSKMALRRWFKTAQIVQAVFFLALILGSTGFALYAAFWSPMRDPSTLVLLIAPALFCLVVYGFYSPSAVIARARGKGKALPQTFKITQDGLDFSTNTNAITIVWNSISRIEEDDKQIYVDMTDKNWFTIPKAAFLDAGHRQTFMDAINAYREGRQPASPAGTSWPPAPDA